LSFTSLNVFATQAPKAVTTAFHQKFNGASNVKWEKESANEFNATFELSGKRMTANFNSNGQWLSSETEVGLSGMPALSKIILQTRFIGWDIAQVYKIEKADGAKLYQAELVKDGITKEVYIKPNGVILK
jgi:hypothetical protein